MQATRATRSSVLGKRPHQSSSPLSPDGRVVPLTPEQSPNSKRPRVSTTTIDGDANKENVPPFCFEFASDLSPTTPRAARALRRNSTELSTPTRLRTITRKHVSTSSLAAPATPTTIVSRLTLVTPPPTPPTSILPIHARARALLRPLSNASAHIAGRDEERTHIQDFLNSFLQPVTPVDDDPKTTLYISGSPGTGKTALVDSILRNLDVEATCTKIVFINCMAMNGIDALWDRILEELEAGKKRITVGRGKKIRGQKAVNALFSRLSYKCILVLDELDHVAASFQSLVSVFSLPQSNASTLRVIGIANTHTLTSSVSQFAVHGVTGVDTLHFSPYTATQLLHILQARFAPLYEDESDCNMTDGAKKFLPVPTLTLLTKKIAALSGDVRSLFEVMRGAIDLAVTSSSPPDQNALNTPTLVVTPTHLLSAFKAYAPASSPIGASSSSTTVSSAGGTPRTTGNSEIVTKVRKLGLQARLVLLSLLLASERLEARLSLSSSIPKSPVKRSHNIAATTPAVGIDSTQLHAYYVAILTRADNEIFTPVSRSEFGDLVGVLETVGLAMLSASLPSRSTSPTKAGRRAFGRSTSFGSIGVKGQDRGQEVRLVEGVRCGEVLRGLGVVGGEKVEMCADIREEEVKAIWQREKTKLARDVKANARAGEGRHGDVFDGAMED